MGFLALSLAACGGPLSPSELRALDDAEARWAARGFGDYTFEMRQACFCPPEVTQWARIDVVAGGVARVVLLETGAEMNSSQRTYFRTVEGVFSSIRAASKDEAIKDVVVEFDQNLGFPTVVRFESKPDVLDGGASYYLRNAGPIP